MPTVPAANELVMQLSNIRSVPEPWAATLPKSFLQTMVPTLLAEKSNKIQTTLSYNLTFVLQINKSTNVLYLFFTDHPFCQAAFEWAQQFWSSEVHQIRHGKIDNEAPFNTSSMTEIPLFLGWPVLGHVKTGYELCKVASVFLMFGRCWLHCEALATENIPWDPSVHLSEDSYSYVAGDCFKKGYQSSWQQNNDKW